MRNFVRTACLLAAFAAGPVTAQNSGPDWVRRPSGEDLRAAFPTAALARGKSGQATLICELTIRGGLENCKVESETPAGYGFGDAALLLAPSFQMTPKIRDGKPEAGVIRIPIDFSNPGGGASSGESGPNSNSRLGSGGNRASMVVSPAWKTAPTFADMAAAWPRSAAGATEGRVSMRCRVTTESKLSMCNIVTETPGGKGFGAAARKLAPLFELAVDPRENGAGKDVFVTLAVSFVDPASSGARAVSHPRWIRGPDEELLAIFPRAAADKGLTKGVGVADCAIAADGSLTDCRVAREDPVGLGFGPAAVRVAQAMQMSPWTDDGRPVDGARIRLPVQFNKPAGAAAGERD